MMAQGKQRNEAVKIAWGYNNRNDSYYDAYTKYMNLYAISDALKKCNISFTQANKAMADLAKAFNNATAIEIMGVKDETCV